MLSKKLRSSESYVLELIEGKWVIVALDHTQPLGWKDLLWLTTAALYIDGEGGVTEYKSIVTAQITANVLNEPFEKKLIEDAFKPLGASDD
jgi:hypothetical protein